MFANVHTLPTTNSDELKKDCMKDMLATSHIFAFNEHNQHHISYSHINQIVPQHYGRFTFKYSHLPYAKDDPNSPGGSGIIIDSHMSKFIRSSGKDSLGRWSWFTLNGKNNTVVTIISVYKSKQGWATYTNQAHHLRTLKLQGHDIQMDPDESWLQDLDKLLQSTVIQGNVIIGGDFNSDLDSPNPIVQLLSKYELRDAFSEYNNIPKSTYIRGNTRIDGIFTSLTTVRAGYSTFEDSPSDHRWMFLEVPFQHMLGYNLISSPAPPRKRATAKIPKVKKKFNDLLQHQMDIHKIAEKTQDLESMLAVDGVLGRKSQDLQHLLDSLTKQVYNSIQHADKHCRKIISGDIPYSPESKSLRTQIKFYKLLYRRACPSMRSPWKQRIVRLASIVGYRGSINITPAEATLLLKSAKQQYNKMKPNAFQLRKDFLLEIARDRDQLDGKGEKVHLKQLVHQEIMKRRYRNVKKAVGKLKGGSVIQVERINSQGTRELVSNRHEVEQEIMKATSSKLMAANSTPLRQLPYSSYFGEHGDFEIWESIVNKDLKIPLQFDSMLVQWLTYLQNTMPDDDCHIDWTPQEYYDSWTKMNEDTGSGPGPNFASIKAIDAGSTANHATSIIALTPMQTGLFPGCWQQAIEQLIPKKTTELLATKLRRITLFAAQLNHNKKYLGKAMMSFGEKHSKLAVEQYGSRKAKSSIQHAWNKRMVLDWITTNHIPSVYIANDASGCYDRILLMVAYLTLRRQGIPAPAAFFSISCLLQIKYRVRTAWGTSQHAFGGSQWQQEFNKSPHGIGQGSGDGPGLWTGISSPLFDILRDRGHGFEIITAITHLSLNLVGFGFVDDTDLLQTLKCHQHPRDIFAQSQRMLDDWNNLLRLTGGALEPAKSHYVHIAQQWSNGKWRFQDQQHSPLRVASPQGHIMPLENITTSDSRLTLGLYQAVDGTETEQTQHMLKKIHQWKSGMQSASLTRAEARLATSITITSTLTYPLPATCLTSQHCKQLQTALAQAALPKLGVTRTAPNALIYGPQLLGGLGLLDIRLYQFTSHLNILLKYGGTATTEGILISNALESLQLEAGSSVSVLNLDPVYYKWLPHTWLWFTLQEAEYYNVIIHARHSLLHKWRVNDTFLMDAWDSLRLTTAQWRTLNHVRMYFQVCTISDISDDSGRRLRTRYTTRQYSLSSVSYQWPSIQDPPKASELRLWDTCLSHLLEPRSTHFKPQYRVYEWTQQASHNSQWWQDRDGLIYSTIDGSCRAYHPIASPAPTRRTTSTYVNVGPHPLPREVAPTIPISQSPASTQCRPTFFPINTTTPTPRTHWALTHLTGTPTQRSILSAQFQDHTAQLLSDGSFKYAACSSAFLSVHDPTLGGTNIVPGREEDNTATRAETGGILGVILWANSVCQEFSISTGSVTCGCDCLGVLQRLWSLSSLVIGCTYNNYDLLREIQHHLHISPIRWTFIHVRGHQDDHKPFHTLTPWERANVLADKNAKKALESWHTSGRINIPSSHYAWTVSFNGCPSISSKIPHQLIYKIRGKQLKAYWMKRLKQPGITQDMICWSTFSRMIAYASQPQRLFRSKHISHITPTGVNLQRRAHREDDICPICGQREDNLHIQTCSGDGVSTTLSDTSSPIQRHLSTCSCPPLISLLQSILSWPRTQQPPTTLHAPLQWAAARQRLLGPFAATWGFFTPLLPSFLQAYWSSTRHAKRSATIWFAKLSHLHWCSIEALWKHRNTILHSPSNQVKTAESIRLNQDIINLLDEMRPIPSRLLPPPTRTLFKHTTPELLSWSLLRRRRWVRQASSAYSAWLNQRHHPTTSSMMEFLLRNTDVT